MTDQLAQESHVVVHTLFGVSFRPVRPAGCEPVHRDPVAPGTGDQPVVKAPVEAAFLLLDASPIEVLPRPLHARLAGHAGRGFHVVALETAQVNAHAERRLRPEPGVRMRLLFHEPACIGLRDLLAGDLRREFRLDEFDAGLDRRQGDLQGDPLRSRRNRHRARGLSQIPAFPISKLPGDLARQRRLCQAAQFLEKPAAFGSRRGDALLVRRSTYVRPETHHLEGHPIRVAVCLQPDLPQSHRPVQLAVVLALEPLPAWSWRRVDHQLLFPGSGKLARQFVERHEVRVEVQMNRVALGGAANLQTQLIDVAEQRRVGGNQRNPVGAFREIESPGLAGQARVAGIALGFRLPLLGGLKTIWSV